MITLKLLQSELTRLRAEKMTAAPRRQGAIDCYIAAVERRMLEMMWRQS